MKWMLIVLLGAMPAHAKPKEAKLLQMWIAKSSLEISGLVVKGEEFWVISDNGDEHFIYKGKPRKKQVTTKDKKTYTLVETRVAFKPEMDLTKLIGSKEYVTSMQQAKSLKEKHRRWDIEGMAVCGDDIYLANERLRQIVKIVDGKHLIPLSLDFAEVFKDIDKGGANAGFEGVAVDCAKQILFVAKERDPRRLFRIDLKTKKINWQGDLKHSKRQGARAIDPWDGKGLITISPDFADLSFDNGFLYVLERNTYEITKVDPRTMKVVDRLSFYFAGRGLYQSLEPFGLAEALVVQGEQIYVGFDNNGLPLASAVAQKHNADGAFGLIMLLQRPPGF